MPALSIILLDYDFKLDNLYNFCFYDINIIESHEETDTMVIVQTSSNFSSSSTIKTLSSSHRNKSDKQQRNDQDVVAINKKPIMVEAKDRGRFQQVRVKFYFCDYTFAVRAWLEAKA